MEKGFEKFESQKENQLNHAKQQANQIVNDAQRKADQIIADLRKMRTQSASAVKENELVDAKTKLNKLEQPINLKKNKVLRRAKNQKEFHVDDDVLVKSYGQRGVLLRKVDDHHWEVQLGILKMKMIRMILKRSKLMISLQRYTYIYLSSAVHHRDYQRVLIFGDKRRKRP